MANPTANADEPAGEAVPARGPSVRESLLIAVAGVIVAAGATIVVLRNRYPISVEALLGAIALIGFGIAAYGLIQSVLALVDSAGERRRQDRVVSERRKGARARQPRE